MFGFCEPDLGLVRARVLVTQDRMCEICFVRLLGVYNNVYSFNAVFARFRIAQKMAVPLTCELTPPMMLLAVARPCQSGYSTYLGS